MKKQYKDKAVKILEEYGSREKKRNTPERRIILKTAYSTDECFSLQWLEEKLKKDNYTVSKATLYNAMEKFMLLKLFVELSLGDNRLTYSHTIGAENRVTLKCTEPKCNSVTNHEMPELDDLRKLVEKRYGFTTRSHSFVMHGTCKKH